jgi:signal transduction histidine kinase
MHANIDYIFQQAFEHSLQANIISIVGSARDTMEVCPVKIHCKLESSLERAMSDKFKMNAFRIVQEQLNNILKHANASEIHITMAEKKAEFALSIADNGIGFDNTKKLNHTGIGISNIISRAEAYRGKARVRYQAGKRL